MREHDTIGDDDDPSWGEHADSRGAEPRRIGRYLVIERVGHGAMGVVYAAFDPELSRKIAIKVLHRSEGEAARPRLIREAQALARLSHPNVVQIYDVGTHEGAVWVAMEFAEGRTLRQWLEQRSPWASRLAVVCQAGRGLAAAHDVGIVHRDFKPDNVLVGDDGLARVVDFGLARAADGSGDEPQLPAVRSIISSGALGDETTSDSLGERMTRTGARLGTPAYMAPEQWTGGAVDARTDQFAFCVVLWEALWGRRPFAAANLAGLGYAITHGRVEPLPGDARAPAWIHRLLLQGLAVDPAQRHPDLRTLLAALAHDPAQSRRRVAVAALSVATVAGAVSVGASIERSPAAVDPCAAADVALDELWSPSRRDALATALRQIGVGYAADTWTRVEANLEAWAGRFLLARREACEATHVRHEQSEEGLDLRIACLDRGRMAFASLLDVLAGADATVLERAAEASASLPPPEECADLERLHDAAVRPEAVAMREPAAALRAELALVRALEQAGHYGEAKSAVDALVEPVVTLSWAPLLAELRTVQGQVAMSLGDVPSAVTVLRQAQLAAIEGGADRQAWLATMSLCHALAETPGAVEEARRTCELARAEGERAHIDDRARSLTEGTRYRVEVAAGDYAAARRHIESAVALREASGADDDVDFAGLLANLGTIIGIMGRPDQAAPLLRRAIELRERLQGPQHPDVGRELHNLGSMLAQTGAYDEAAPLLERALQIKRDALGEAHTDLSYTYVALGNVAVAQSRFVEAEQHFRASLAIDERTLGPDHPQLGYALLGLSDRFIRDGRPAEALPLLRRAIAIREATQGPDHPELAWVLIALGVAELDVGHADAAIAELRRARKILGPQTEPQNRADVDWPLARALWLQGRARDEAVALARAAKADYLAAVPPRPDLAEGITTWLEQVAPAR
ncbi:MAG: serine/threonine-protein kinase [Nannocystaceae bacterium]|nr:serine/threonine-protein kinase [Nannocystaceae bacterium]